MLKLCKSCKALVDTNKHDFCPKCGANFNYDERKNVEKNLHHEKADEQLAQQRREAVEKQMKEPKELKINHDEYSYNSGLNDVSERADEQLAQQRRDAVEKQMIPPKDTNPKIDPYKYNPHQDSNIPKQTSTIASVQPEPVKPIKQGNNTYNQPTSSFPEQSVFEHNQSAPEVNPVGGESKKKKGCGWAVMIIIFGFISIFGGIISEVADVLTSHDNTFYDETDNTTPYDEWNRDEYAENTPPPANITENPIPSELLENAYGYDYTDTYYLVATEVKEAQVMFEPGEGNMFISIRFNIKNIGNNGQLHFSYPRCFTDGEERDIVFASSDPIFLPGELSPDDEYEGYVCYEIPRNADVISVIYRDELELKVANPFCENLQTEENTEFYGGIYTNEYSLECVGVREVYGYEPAEGYAFVAFDYCVINYGNEPFRYDGYPACFVDNCKCTVLSPETTFVLSEIPAGESYLGCVCYEVPLGTQEFRIATPDRHILDITSFVIAPPKTVTDATGYIEVGLYEYAEFDGMQFACTAIGEPVIIAEPASEGYQYLLFDFELTNYGDRQFLGGDIPRCIADGVEAEINYGNYEYAIDLFCPDELPHGFCCGGEVCYEIPVGTEKIELIYKDVRVTVDGPF